MQNNNVAIVDGTTYVQVGAMFFPKNALYLDTRQDKLIAIFTMQGYQITNWLDHSQYKDSSNVPYATFSDALTDMQTVFFK